MTDTAKLSQLQKRILVIAYAEFTTDRGQGAEDKGAIPQAGAPSPCGRLASGKARLRLPSRPRTTCGKACSPGAFPRSRPARSWRGCAWWWRPRRSPAGISWTSSARSSATRNAMAILRRPGERASC